MPNVDYIERIRDKCDIDETDVVSDNSILLNLSSAIRTYQNIRPLEESCVIRLNRVYTHLLSEATKWSKHQSNITALNIISASPDDNELEVRDIQQGVQIDLYRVDYVDGQPYIKFGTLFTGTYKVYYTYFELEMDAFDTVIQEGLVFLAASNVCSKLAAKYNKVFSSQMTYDQASYKQKTANYQDLAEAYNKQALDILNISEETRNQAFSMFAKWPYLERRIRIVGI